MPEVPLQSGTETPGGEALTKLEGTLAEWLAAIQTALSQEADRTIAGRGGPLSSPFRHDYVPSRLGQRRATRTHMSIGYGLLYADYEL